MGASLFRHKFLQSSKTWIISFFPNSMFGSTCQSLDFFSSFGAVRKEPSFFLLVIQVQTTFKGFWSLEFRLYDVHWNVWFSWTTWWKSERVKTILLPYAATRADKRSCWCPHQHSQQVVTVDLLPAILGWKCTRVYPTTLRMFHDRLSTIFHLWVLTSRVCASNKVTRAGRRKKGTRNSGQTRSYYPPSWMIDPRWACWVQSSKLPLWRFLFGKVKISERTRDLEDLLKDRKKRFHYF